MAKFLFGVGRWSFLHRKIVVAVWLGLLTVGIIGAATLSATTNDDFDVSGIESTEAFDLINERTPGVSADGATARVVFQAPEGQSLNSKKNRATIAGSLEQLSSTNVQTVDDPFEADTVSQDQSVAYATVSYAKNGIELTDQDRTALRSAATDAKDAGLTVAIGGDALLADGEAPLAELIGVVIALVVLIITFGSLLAAGMPLVTAMIGVAIGVASITILTGFTELSSTTPILGVMLGLAVGIDYALFIMSRYQHEVRAGRPLAEAAGVAVGTAGSAVVFGGITVIIALAGLAICGIAFLTEMGLAGAGMILLAVLISLTLLPAALGFGGKRVVQSRLRFLRGPETEGAGRTHGQRWAELISRFKTPALVVGIAVAAITAIPVLSMQLALPDDGTADKHSDARIAYDLIADNFGPGANGPLLVVVDTKNSADPAGAVDASVTKLESVTTNVAAVVPPATDDKSAKVLDEMLNVLNYTTIAVVPESGPSQAATADLVHTIRTTVADLPAETGARALVTGQAAVGVDVTQSLADAFPRYLIVVVGLAIVLLILFFRSIIVPITAAVGFVLSLGIGLGSTVAVFQWGWLSSLLGLDTTGPVLFILPLLLTGILFGLAMDYQVFLVTRMREAYVHGTPAHDAVIQGFNHSARVVTAAAVIMAGVFGGFALGDDTIIKAIGFALTIGVLADAFLVRMMIVPALMTMLGDKAWWIPSWLDRLLPNIDIEGESLTEALPDVPGIETQPQN